MLTSMATFAVAATLVVLLPGPDTLVVVRNLVKGGRRVAARTVLGVLSGLTVWVVTAVLGVSAVLRASHDAYIGLRFAGAVYLVYLGVRSLWARAGTATSPRRLARYGLHGRPAHRPPQSQGGRLFRHVPARLRAPRVLRGLDVADLRCHIRRAHRRPISPSC